MISLRNSTYNLVLPPSAEADLELIGVLAEELEDSFSVPFEIPLRGNEDALGHVHQLSALTRILEQDGWELWHKGIRLHTGTLAVIGSGTTWPGTVRVTFSVDGFVAALKDQRLQQADLGDDIYVGNSAVDLPGWAKARNSESWPSAPVCFPMVYNPDLYGSANKAWFPRAEVWDSTKSYAVNDLVEFEEGSVVRRTWRYQCIAATSAGQSPATQPAKWRRTAYGIVNHWNYDTGEFYTNDETSGNVYAMCPYLYVKEVLQRLLAGMGYTPEGEWWNDPYYHSLILHNATALDTQVRENYLLASQTSQVSYAAGVGPKKVPAQDDSTPPNEDTLTIWDTTNFTWECPSQGNYIIRVRVKCTFSLPDRLAMDVYNEDAFVNKAQVTGGFSGPFLTEHDKVLVFNLNFGAGEVGQNFSFRVRGQNYGNLIEVVLNDCYIQSWLSQGTVNGYADRITPNQHVPDYTVSEFLLDIRDTFCLQLTPDRARGTVTFNYNKALLHAAAPPDWSHRQASTIELDHSKRTRGLRFSWSLDEDEHGEWPALERMAAETGIAVEGDLPTASALKVYAVSERMHTLYVTRPDGNNVYWYPIGTYLPEATVGQADGAMDVAPKWAPFAMTLVSVLGEHFWVPLVLDGGTSDFFGVASPCKFRFGYYHGMQPNGNSVEYPFATPFRATEGGDQIAKTDLDWPALLAEHWQEWANALTTGDPVRMDLKLDHNVITGKEHKRLITLNDQRMLVRLLPVTYGPRPLIARGADLLRIIP